MKYLCLTSSLCLIVFLLSSCTKPVTQSPASPPEEPVLSTVELPISVKAPRTSWRNAVSLLQIKQFIGMQEIKVDNMSQFLVAEEIEQALGRDTSYTASPLPPRQYRYWEIGQQALPNYRLVIFLRESIDEQPASVSVCIRTFCYDKTLMGHLRLAHWDEATQLAISGKIDVYRKISVQIGDEAPQIYQINKFGKFMNASP